MRDVELDGILSGERAIVPSSGFAASVMEKVRREAAAPPPIPFPWKRALPGMAACAAVLMGAFFARHSGVRPEVATAPDWQPVVSSVSAVWAEAVRWGLGWVVLALLIPLGSVALSKQLTGWRSWH